MFPELLVTKADFEKLSGLNLSPVIFQERIVRQVDYRLTVVDGEIFTSRVDTSFEGAETDWRNDSGATCFECELPEIVHTRIKLLVAQLGLFFCTVDLIESKDDGEIYFLEINECGQFLFVEMDTGLPISQAIAKGLLGHSTA